jgi:hypothetical protein
MPGWEPLREKEKAKGASEPKCDSERGRTKERVSESGRESEVAVGTCDRADLVVVLSHDPIVVSHTHARSTEGSDTHTRDIRGTNVCC